MADDEDFDEKSTLQWRKYTRRELKGSLALKTPSSTSNSISATGTIESLKKSPNTHESTAGAISIGAHLPIMTECIIDLVNEDSQPTRNSHVSSSTNSPTDTTINTTTTAISAPSTSSSADCAINNPSLLHIPPPPPPFTVSPPHTSASPASLRHTGAGGSRKRMRSNGYSKSPLKNQRQLSMSAQSKSGQTSLLQFATTVSRSVSDSLQVRLSCSNTSSSAAASLKHDRHDKPPSRVLSASSTLSMGGSSFKKLKKEEEDEGDKAGGSCAISSLASSTTSCSSYSGSFRSEVKGGGVSLLRAAIAAGETPNNCIETDVSSINGRVGRRGSRGNLKPCPFYKRVPETGMVVDAFSYGSIPDCPAYFLSHYHADHYMGLTKRFNHPIYCSQVTANLVQLGLKVSPSLLHPLPLHTPCIVNGVEVTLIDANHCPGAIMFLFKMCSGRKYLHTGDFRFIPAMASNPLLKGLTLHQLFLDTTYCNPQYSFPSQQEVVEYARRKAQEALRRCPTTLIVCGTYTIGKEKVFLGIAEALNSKIYVSKEKLAILKCLEWPALQDLLTTDCCSASVHVLPMRKLNTTDLSLYLDSNRPTFSHILAFSPTGWCHSSARSNLSAISPKTSGSVSVYGIPYSEHSSFSELKSCVQQLAPLKVVPTVNNFSSKKRREMERFFELWRHPTPKTFNSRQMSIDSAFS